MLNPNKEVPSVDELAPDEILKKIEERYCDEMDDLDQNNPTDCSMETWQEIYSNPDWDMDNDHSMDY